MVRDVAEQFHHSSFMAGQPVSFAGELQVTDGMLRVVTNKSGHYKPTEENAFVQLLFFQRKGVPLDNVTFRWCKAHGVFEDENAAVRTSTTCCR